MNQQMQAGSVAQKGVHIMVKKIFIYAGNCCLELVRLLHVYYVYTEVPHDMHFKEGYLSLYRVLPVSAQTMLTDSVVFNHYAAYILQATFVVLM